MWVKSSSYRVASRAVNALGAGTPVESIDEMKRAATWLISVPSEELVDTIGELCAAQLDWCRRTILILDTEAESAVANCFRARGAAVATFAPIDTEESRYVAEGDADAVRSVRTLIEDSHRRVIEIRKGTKASFLAGAHAATKQIMPYIADAVECFQTAGISNPDAKFITERLLTGTMRSYFRAGRRAIKS